MRILAVPRDERPSRATELNLEEPEILLAVCGILQSQKEANPANVRDEAEFFYDFLETPERPIGLFDERDYFLGETALIAGSACRFLYRREEARRWFDRSDAAFRQTVNAVAEWGRVTYQRLALRVEEREFEPVLELLPSLIQTFRKLEMWEDALKCRFLAGVSFMNMERYEPAVTVFREICVEAERLGSESLLAVACNNLVQLQALLGNSEEALDQAKETLRLFQKLDNRVGLAKLQWGIGILLRTHGNLSGSLEAYREAKDRFLALQMPSDVAALSLVLADIHLEMGNEAEARRQVLQALPIIQSENMVPEGMAALSLLQESIRQKNVNRQALREVHGYFEDLSGPNA